MKNADNATSAVHPLLAFATRHPPSYSEFSFKKLFDDTLGVTVLQRMNLFTQGTGGLDFIIDQMCAMTLGTCILYCAAPFRGLGAIVSSRYNGTRVSF